MNTNKKHKSKNKNKPPNLNPIEKSDTAIKSENVEEVQETINKEKLISKVEVKVQSEQEIVCASPNVSTELETEPKKPKRNKNKNKKQNTEGKTGLESNDKVSEVIECKTTENIENIQETVTNEPDMTPIARKNNKNKKNSEAQVVQPTACDKFEPFAKENEPTVLGTEPNETFSKDKKDETTEQDVKSQKKKNKKKKRHDSERSEKSEEVISCTAAFQKLLDSKTEKSEKDEGLLLSSKQNENKNVSKQEQEITLEHIPRSKEIESGDLTAHKKKNKKHKNVATVEDNIPEQKATEMSNPAHQEEFGKDKKKMDKDTFIGETEEKITKDKQTLSEPKSKAKIAKPVERKQKQNTETLLSEEKVIESETTTIVEERELIKPVSLIDILDKKPKKDEKLIEQPRETKIETKLNPQNITDEKTVAKDGSILDFSLASNVSTKKEKKPTNKNSGTVDDVLKREDNTLESVTEPVVSVKKERKAPPVTAEKKVDDVIAKEEFSLEIDAKPNVSAKKEKKVLKKQDINDQKKINQGHGETEKKDLHKVNILPEKTEKIYEGEKNKSQIEPENKEKHLEKSLLVTSENKEPFTEALLTDQKDDGKTKKDEAKQSIENFDVAAQFKPFDEEASSQSDDENFILPSLLDISEDIPKKNNCKLTQAAEVSQDKKDEVNFETEKSTQIISLEVNKPEPCDELQVPSSKRKKRKNSPKPPTSVKVDIKQAEKESIPDTEISTEKQIAMTEVQQPTEIKGIINIESDNTAQIESKCQSVVETTPNLIEYPRSISEQSSDTNNNTSIQDISTVNPIEIPIVLPDTPIIKGSGVSPVKISEMKCLVPALSKEKTDLKSKVMEVNKDMEDLRLSLERSLAELTSLEDKEKNVEKAYEEKHKNIEVGVTLENVEHEEQKSQEDTKSQVQDVEPILPPPRQEGKGKGKSKKKNKQDVHQNMIQASSTQTQQITSSQPSESNTSTDEKKDDKTEKTAQKTESTEEKTKQQDHVVETQNADITLNKSDGDKYNNEIYDTINKTQKIKHQKDKDTDAYYTEPVDYETIENFEDAMTSSIDDVNKSFEIIANESTIIADSSNNPQISITAPEEDTAKKDAKQKINPVSQPKNLLGHPDIPVPSNRTDYKKEKNKPPNAKQAKVKIKDAVEIEPKSKESKESQTDAKNKFLKRDSTVEESVTCVTSENEEYVYKYSFRKVFLPNICHICKKELKAVKVPCNYCSLIFYCSEKHKDEGWSQHQTLCFAVSTVAHHKNQKHIYADAKGLSGQEYRLFRMQLIVACEKVLRRRLVPWEQEAILYPRICADVACREYRQGKLMDCDGCGQISYCAASPDHVPKSHQKWCKSYCLYQKLVLHQQTQGRLAPKLPTRVLSQAVQIPDKINMVLASLYEEKIDMNDIQYAALTQIATAPLTAAYSYQLYNKSVGAGRLDKNAFTIHLVNAELQYEADVLNKWERLFLHLHPTVEELKVVLTGRELNPDQLPLSLLGKIKLCANCRLHSRRLSFSFQDKTYTEYWDSNEYETPDIVCAFNASIQRSTMYNGKDHWPLTINTIFKLKCPFIITFYTMNELNRDINRIKECSKGDFKVISDAKFNPFASVRPDRNFITDDEIPLLFKNYCFAVLCGV